MKMIAMGTPHAPITMENIFAHVRRGTVGTERTAQTLTSAQLMLTLVT